MSLAVSALKTFRDVEHNVHRSLSQSINEPGVSTQLDHLVPLTLQHIPDRIDRFFRIKFLPEIGRLILLAGEILLLNCR